MTILQLKYAVTAAEKGTMSEAAQSLFIAQPSLTSAIKELEKEIGITIFRRTNKGIVVTREGDEFLGYARQVLQQFDMLENRYTGETPKTIFSVSSQHYAFAVNAFVDIIKKYGNKKYDFTMRETQTYEIIQDVSTLRSEVGILYMSGENEKIMTKIIAESGLEFTELFTAEPHVFIYKKNPLAEKESITLDDLAPYPYLCFEQGEYNSFYFSEEILSTIPREMTIKVRDRATLFNLLIGLNGYTISTGVLSSDLNGKNIISRPLESDEYIKVGTIRRKGMKLSRIAEEYISSLSEYIR